MQLKYTMQLHCTATRYLLTSSAHRELRSLAYTNNRSGFCIILSPTVKLGLFPHNYEKIPKFVVYALAL